MTPIDLDAIDDRSVLADLLMQRGDPLGELISVQRALDALEADAPAPRRQLLEAQAAQLLTAHHAELFGPLAPHAQAPEGSAPRASALEIEWRGGFAHRVAIESPGAELELADIYRALRRLPLARFLHHLEVGSGDYAGFMAALAADPPPTLATLTLHGQKEVLAASQTQGRRYRGATAREASHVRAVLDGALFAALPALDSLGLLCSFDALRPLDAPALRSLLVWYLEEGDALVRSALPAVEVLSANRTTLSLAQLERLPRLAEVSAMQCGGVPALLRGLLSSPTLPRLRGLELWACGLEDADLALLTAHAAQLAHLETLALMNHNFSGPALAAATRALPQLRTSY